MAKFPDLTGDGEVTQADVLKGRGVYKKGGSVMKHDHGHKPMAKMSHGGHYCWGGKVMKKAEGGGVTEEDYRNSSPSVIKVGSPAKKNDTEAQRVGRAMSKKYKADEDFDVYKEYNRKKGPQTYRSDEDEDEDHLWQFLNDRMNATTEDLHTAKSQAGYKKGGMAKGGNWIQSAIKKPGALKKSLGVPMGEKIPAGKLKTASKAPGKMGQRARLAMTLKGMK